MSVFSRFFSRERLPDKRTVSSEIDQEAAEAILGVRINDVTLYETALTHRSLFRGKSNVQPRSNERLEFLGDAVLGLVVAHHLYADFGNQDEGFLTRLRAKLVNGQALARDAAELGLGELILMSNVMDTSEGRSSPSILSDAFEAVIGAIYLDSGYAEAVSFVERTVLKDVDLKKLAGRKDNFKSTLLELAQSNKWPQPHYRVIEEKGPSHDRIFTVEVLVKNRRLGEGTARNKKKAEQAAAKNALAVLSEENDS